MVGMFEVDDLTNKVDVGSKPGTMWSLSSQKPGHGIAELRDDDTTKLWQSDGLLPHLISIQFAQRTAVTHVSLYMDYRLDDSYTPIKIRVMAGTHHHDLVEVRTRDFDQPIGWKHFVLDKFDSRVESEESDSGSSASSSLSELSPVGQQRLTEKDARRDNILILTSKMQRQHHSSPLLACGVSKKHPPIYAYLVQICILANHAVGKDTHVRGIKIFGPPTIESREKAKRDAKKSRESRRITGSRAIRVSQEKALKRKKRARDAVIQWVRGEGTEEVDSDCDSNSDGEPQEQQHDDEHSTPRPRSVQHPHISTSRTLELLSTLR